MRLVATRIAVVHYHSSPTWSCRELISAAEKMGAKAFYERIQAIDAIVSAESIGAFIGGKPLDADAIIVRSLGAAPSLEQILKRVGVLEAYRISGGIVVNKPIQMLLARDKWLSLLRLKEKGLPIPETMVSENPYSIMRFISRHRRVVVKPLIGSLGLGSTLIDDTDVGYQVSRALTAFKQPIYAQEYIEKPGYDYRIFVVGGEVVAAMKRIAPTGSWKTNIARGAKAAPLSENEDPEAFDLAIKAAEALGLDYSGVDIVVDKNGGHYIVEANASPLWRGLMMATGVNPAYNIIDYIIRMTRR